jgi:hypothetical protein
MTRSTLEVINGYTFPPRNRPTVSAATLPNHFRVQGRLGRGLVLHLRPAGQQPFLHQPDYAVSKGSLGRTVLAAYSAKRDQSSAISNKIVRSCGVSMWRASSTHCAANCRYASHLSIRFSPPLPALCSIPSRSFVRLTNCRADAPALIAVFDIPRMFQDFGG